MNEKIEVPTMRVPPLKKICMTIGQLPASYIETMSYYEMLIWFIHYLRDDIIPVVNANGEATQELQELYIALQEYVNESYSEFTTEVNNKVEELETYMNNYFDNLDVQDEIDNKLDEMLEDGTLYNLLINELNVQLTFDSVNDMKQSTYLIDGSNVRTLGYYAVNDGGGAIYKITDTESLTDHQEELNNGLYATLIDTPNDINIEVFGAYGDGSHDDTAAFNSAFAYLTNKSKNLLLNSKTYKVRCLQILSNINLIGKGNTSIIKGHEDATSDEYRIIKGYSNANNWSVKNLCIDVNPTERVNITTSDIGISINGSSNVIIENVKIIGSNTTDAYCLRIGAYNGTRPNNVIVRNCEINVINGGFNGIAITAGKNITIDNNIVNNNVGGSGFCIDVEANTAENPSDESYWLNNIILNNNKCYGSSIAISGKTNPSNNNINVTNNYIELTNTNVNEGLILFQINDVKALNNHIVYNLSSATIDGTSYNAIRINGTKLNISNNTINLKHTLFSVFRIYGTTSVGDKGTEDIIINKNIITFDSGVTASNLYNVASTGKVIISNNISNNATVTYGVNNSNSSADNELIFTNNNISINGRALYIKKGKKVIISNNLIESYRNIIESVTNLSINNNIINHTSGQYSAFDSDIFSANTRVNFNNNLIYGSSTGGIYQESPYIGSGTAAPVSGTWNRGSIIYNSTPSSGNPIGWMCITAGDPGTWVSLGNL